MRKYIYLFGVLCFSASLFGQAKKPTIMVMPSDVWCTNLGYSSYDENGTKIIDYKKAAQNDANLLLVVSKLSSLMGERGFPLVDMLASIKSMEVSSAIDQQMGSQESVIDKILKSSTADIVMQVSCVINKVGAKHSVNYSLRAIDSYSLKQVAGAEGVGAASYSSDPAALIEEAVLVHIDNFAGTLQTHFDDLLTNGREVVMEVRVKGNSSINLDTEFQGLTLLDVIDDWMAANSVSGRFSLASGTETYATFNQIRIPIYAPNGRAMDMRLFTRNLAQKLRTAPYNVPVKVVTQGLGKVIIWLGED